MLALLAPFAFFISLFFFILSICMIVCFFRINKNVRLMRQNMDVAMFVMGQLGAALQKRHDDEIEKELADVTDEVPTPTPTPMPATKEDMTARLKIVAIILLVLVGLLVVVCSKITPRTTATPAATSTTTNAPPIFVPEPMRRK
jgi:hypothetical protein